MLWFKKKQRAVRQPHLMAGQNDYVFRRSRTLTGTVSANVAVSAPGRGQLKTERLKLHELKAHRRKLMRLLGVVTLAIALLAFLLVNFILSPPIRYPQPGAHKPDTRSYQNTIYNYFGDHPLERFGFLLNAPGLDKQLQREHTEILSTAVERDWYGGNVRLIIVFRQPLLVWHSGTKQFYVDSHGFAFAYNHFVEPTLSVTDQSGLPPDQSGAVASTRFIRFLGQMVGAINSYNKGKVISVIIPPSTREIDVKLAGRDYIIKTDSDRDPLWQAEDINSALTYLDARGVKPQYLDLRVPHKAFYK